MNFRRLIPRALKSRLSFTTKVALERRFADFAPSTKFLASPLARGRAYRELAQCHSTLELLQFARNWLGVGSVQIESEITGLLDHLRKLQPKTVCEIGTESGGTSLLLGRALPSVELLVCADLFVKNRPRLKRFMPPKLHIHFVNDESASPTAVAKVTRALASKPLDVLFIDGDHRYVGVQSDFLAYRHLVRPGGAVVFHDIVPDHQTRFGMATGRWAGGVPVFWSQIKSLYPHEEFINDPNQDGFGIGLIQYDPTVDPVPAMKAPVETPEKVA